MLKGIYIYIERERERDRERERERENETERERERAVFKTSSARCHKPEKLFPLISWVLMTS